MVRQRRWIEFTQPKLWTACMFDTGVAWSQLIVAAEARELA